ncbi:Uncharacterised protein [Mycobacterium tuberculosis]|nr:Uncharacterised protein [Mycobacterium tuberculosis]CKO18582.1 Uncharacterised protein [Mycobacterium tuberculosis]CKW57297.1 Uncharacterised protein [Mycobacterium tuberculosis]
MASAVIPAAAAGLLTGKSPGLTTRPRGSSRAALRVNPPRVCPTVSTPISSTPAPTNPRAPRLLSVASPGLTDTSPSGSHGCARVSATLVPNTSRIGIDRNPVTMWGILTTICNRKPAMKTQAPK